MTRRAVPPGSVSGSRRARLLAERDPALTPAEIARNLGIGYEVAYRAWKVTRDKELIKTVDPVTST